MQQAIARAEQIRARLAQRRVELRGAAPKPVTASIGVAAFDETTDQIERLLGCADEALYQAKREGRDRVVAARPALDRMQADSAASASS